MRQTDIAVVGAGIAGSTAAAMLGAAGYRAVLIDPHEVYPPDFRCEKLDSTQVALLHKTGLADGVLRAATPYQDVWVVRFGRLVERRHINQVGILYDALVSAVRAQIPAGIDVVRSKVTAISTSSDRQRLTLSNGEELSARVVILANGLNGGLRKTLGMASQELSACHSVSIGFNVEPLGRPAFSFPALTYFPERASDRMAYLTLFPTAAGMRANLFVYRHLRDPWLQRFRDAPEKTLLETMRGIGALMGDFAVSGPVKIRPVDLCVTTGHRQPGVVLVGDAFATSCPAAGTGLNKVFTDVERLCNVHIPGWLASPGMGLDKIAAFYDDPVKRACDDNSARQARYLRSLSSDDALGWRLRRGVRGAGHIGAVAFRHARNQLTFRSRGAAQIEPTAPAS